MAPSPSHERSHHNTIRKYRRPSRHHLHTFIITSTPSPYSHSRHISPRPVSPLRHLSSLTHRPPSHPRLPPVSRRAARPRYNSRPQPTQRFRQGRPATKGSSIIRLAAEFSAAVRETQAAVGEACCWMS